MIPTAYEDLLQAPNTAILVTLAADGAPQASPVWCGSSTTPGAHHASGYRLPLMLCGNPHIPEEIVAEVFAKVLPRWRPVTPNAVALKDE